MCERQEAILNSIFHCYKRDQWVRFTHATPLTITASKLKKITGIIEELTLEEVHKIYNPLIQIISDYMHGKTIINNRFQQFTGEEQKKAPFIIGIAGSVAAGKSTLARLLLELLRHTSTKPRIVLVPTDVFLYNNEILEEKKLMMRKGFPESYDITHLIHFLACVKAGKRNLSIPVYSHLHYNILPQTWQKIPPHDILILEGLNVLQTNRMQASHNAMPFVSDFFDFSIYLDAQTEDLERWYVMRFLKLRQQAFSHTESFFHRFAKLSDTEAVDTAKNIWKSINQPNLHDNIAPTKYRAHMVLQKNRNHSIDQIMLRKL